jgi:hypothetical protein
MTKANRGGWKTCPRGHKYRGAEPCPVCWPDGRKPKVCFVAAARAARLSRDSLLLESRHPGESRDPF